MSPAEGASRGRPRGWRRGPAMAGCRTWCTAVFPALGLFISRAGSLIAWRGSSRRPCGTPVRVSASAKAASGGLASRIAAMLSRPGPWTLPRIRVVLRAKEPAAADRISIVRCSSDTLRLSSRIPLRRPWSPPALGPHRRRPDGSTCAASPGHPQPPGHRGDRGVLRGIITGVIAHQPDRLGPWCLVVPDRHERAILPK
jgi:hypothetical protein